MKEYDHLKIEKKWQSVWAKKKAYKTENPSAGSRQVKKKYYVLDMFPYPSGVGLHVGHPKGYIGSDIFARMKRMQGFNVLHPMGYDAFGLPAEQYALEHNIHPRKAVEENVRTFEKQLSIIGLSYDWERRVNTTDPGFYRWTQWIFLKIYNSWYNKTTNKAEPISDLIKRFEKSGNTGVSHSGENVSNFSATEWKSKTAKEKQDILMKYRLAYEGFSEVNWCPKLGTVLANDEVLDSPKGPVSERGGYPVEKKSMRQWFLRITAYAERLLSGLEGLHWSDHIKEIQKNWIGRKTGINISYKVDGLEKNIVCFTTRPDTNFGATFLVIGPEHPYLENREALKLSKDIWQKVLSYKQMALKLRESNKIDLSKEKTGVSLGIYCTNTLNNYRMPVYVADYVIGNVGTGAVIGVPGHDKRDFEFAMKFNIPVVRVVQKDISDNAPIVNIDQVQEEDGTMVNSGFLNGINIHDATEKIMDYMEQKGYGKRVVNYKMRDAIFARQRYWGEPIPLIYDKDGVINEVPDNKLPLKLPDVKSYQPTGTGESPLAGVKAWVKQGLETNTMPGWAGSSWYFLRYMDPKNKKVFADKKFIKYWGEVDMYVGGAEHATGHLLYSRFWNKFLKDFGLAVMEEPFRTLKNQGIIFGPDGRRMSKRWGNTINPNDVVKNYGADTLRIYEMFMGPFDGSLPWSTDNIIGSRRFIEKVWKIQSKVKSGKLKAEKNTRFEAILHKTIKKVGDDIESFGFNTAISAMMILVNEMEKQENVSQQDFEMFLKIFSPFAPHITEEIWSTLGHKNLLVSEDWPKVDSKKLVDSEVKIIIQINGKMRGDYIASTGVKEVDLVVKVKAVPSIAKWLLGREIKRVIFLPNKLVNFVL